jgi:UDP-2-acetamido-3-amino-2,3-dideoxy-glucuronate N-acetyltransferase
MKYFLHKTSIVDEGANIGENTKIWHFSHICSGAIIGDNVVIGQNVYVGNNVIIGNDCKIQNNISVYDNVILEEGVFCGPSMVFTNVYNPRALINRKKEFRNTLVKKGATIGANCTLICGVTIGKYAFIGAGALVNKDIPDFALILGVPGRHVGWMSKQGKRIKLPLIGNAEYLCQDTGDKYELISGKLYRI